MTTADPVGCGWTGCSTCPKKASAARARFWSATSSTSWPRGYAATTPGAESVLRDVGLQLRVLAFQLFHPRLDDVADADDADQLAVLEHRHVPDPVLGHQQREAVDRVRLATGRDHRCHDLLDRQREDRRSMGVQLAHHVTLGDDALHAVGSDHHHGADVVFGEPGEP